MSILVLAFRSDTTFALPCQHGDLLLLARHPSWPEAEFWLPDEWRVVDLWYLRDGDRVTFTNRISDLPPWFELHPTEAGDALAWKYLRKLESGWRPGEATDGPNIWRVCAGDRVAWIGRSRPGYEADHDLLAVLEFHHNALGFGEPPEGGELLDWIGFGSLPPKWDASPSLESARRALQVIRRLGLPDTMSPDWYLT